MIPLGDVSQVLFLKTLTEPRLLRESPDTK